MRQFHHVGIVTDQPHPGEIYVPATKVHVTNPNMHPHRIEYLRYEPDSPITGPLRDLPHIAFKVSHLEAEMACGEILLEPFQPMEHVRAVFMQIDGAVFEFMQFDGDSSFDGLH